MPPEVPDIPRPAVLIFSKTNGYRHDSIAQAVPAVESLVAARGSSSFATENAAVFHPAHLAKFDVVVFASATGDMFTPPQRKAFEDWLAAGHGFVGLDGAAVDSHPDWYKTILGYHNSSATPAAATSFPPPTSSRSTARIPRRATCPNAGAGPTNITAGTPRPPPIPMSSHGSTKRGCGSTPNIGCAARKEGKGCGGR